MYNPKYEITPHIMQTLIEIERLNDQIDRSVILPAHEVELRYRATVEAVHSSTSIEGNPLNLQQTKAALSGESARLSRTEIAEIEVRNYRDALDYVSERERTKAPIAEDDILKIHHLITNSLLNSSRTGRFRRNPVYIEHGGREIVYEAAPASQVQPAVRGLLDWLNSSDAHSLIKAAVFHFQFVSIHPFADGNGRATRALTALYMGLTGFDFKGSLALDTYFSSDRQAYYSALSNQGKDYSTRLSSDLTPWIAYFLDGVEACAKVLAAEIAILSRAVNVSPDLTKIARDQMDILDYVERFGSITATEADEILAGTRRTAQRKLKELIDLGYLKMVGSSRDIKYIKT